MAFVGDLAASNWAAPARLRAAFKTPEHLKMLFALAHRHV